jgi:hypothetical protein
MFKKLFLVTFVFLFAVCFSLGTVFFQSNHAFAECSRWEIPKPIVDYVIAPKGTGWTSYFCPLSEQDFFYGKIKTYNSGNKTENVTIYLQRYDGTKWNNVAHFSVHKNGIYHNNAPGQSPEGSYFFREYGGKPFVIGAQYRLFMDNSDNDHDVHVWIDQAGMYYD